MTREEAVKELQESLETLKEYDIAHSSRLMQALKMAIRTLENHDIFMKRAYSQGKQDALSQEPCVTESQMDEYIKNENPKLILSSVDENEYKDVLKEPCDDAISREWLKTAIHNFYDGLKHTPTEEDIQAYIDVAPSVNPQYTGNEFFNFDAPIVKKSMEQERQKRNEISERMGLQKQ